MVCSATSASAAPVIPGASVALLSNPTVVLGGLIGLVLAAGGAVIYSKPQGIGKGVIDRLMEEAEKAEEFWKKAVAEETLNEKLVSDSVLLLYSNYPSFLTNYFTRGGKKVEGWRRNDRRRVFGHGEGAGDVHRHSCRAMIEVK